MPSLYTSLTAEKEGSYACAAIFVTGYLYELLAFRVSLGANRLDGSHFFDRLTFDARNRRLLCRGASCHRSRRLLISLRCFG